VFLPSPGTIISADNGTSDDMQRKNIAILSQASQMHAEQLKTAIERLNEPAGGDYAAWTWPAGSAELRSRKLA
jgi:hypothetical protein